MYFPPLAKFIQTQSVFPIEKVQIRNFYDWFKIKLNF